jgi:hypothetical protein
MWYAPVLPDTVLLQTLLIRRNGTNKKTDTAFLTAMGVIVKRYFICHRMSAYDMGNPKETRN